MNQQHQQQKISIRKIKINLQQDNILILTKMTKQKKSKGLA